MNTGNAQCLDASGIHQNLDMGCFVGKENTSIRAVAWGGGVFCLKSQNMHA